MNTTYKGLVIVHRVICSML